MRPRRVTDEQLLIAARAEFLVHGSRASVPRIAATAGVSEAAVFKRFGSKSALLHAAVTQATEQGFTGTLPPRLTRKSMERLALALLDHFDTIVPMVLMSMMHMERGAVPLPLQGEEPAPVRGVNLLSRYFAEQAAAGHIRPMTTRVLAHMFAGTLWHFSFVRVALNVRPTPAVPTEDFVRDLVSLLWPGVRPHKRSQENP